MNIRSRVPFIGSSISVHSANGKYLYTSETLCLQYAYSKSTAGRESNYNWTVPTVGNLIVFRVMPQATDQFHNLDNTIFGSYLLLSRSLGSQTTEQCFRIEIITLFHQLVQHFLHGSIPASHPFYSHTITRQFGKAIRLGSRDSITTKTSRSMLYKKRGSR